MYLRRVISAVVPLLLSTALSAQMHHVDKPQRVTRAIGVYEWTGDMAKPDASRLIPVSIFINGHFEDAGVYLAQPIPLAVETGNVYAIQKSGDPVGTLDLDYARDVVDRRDVADDNPIGAWYGYGRFLPLSTEPKPALNPSAHPPVIVASTDDDKPHFVNRSPGAGSSTSSTPTTPAPPDDPDRPTLHRSDTNTAGTNTTGKSPTSSTTPGNAPLSPGTASVPDDDPERPTLKRHDDTQDEKHRKHKGDTGAVIPMGSSLNEDPNRPMLHRGKVASEQAPPQLTGIPKDLHQAIAVSDPVTHEAHVFAREWDSPIERADTLAAMQTLAQPLAQQYMTTNHLQAAPASTAPKLVTSSSKTSRTRHSTHRAAAPKGPAPLTFQEAQIEGFTLSYGGLPTFVYTAAIPTASGPLLRVTLVAQRLPSGELQTSLHSVTDDAHLDRTPWMRLVDAVDPDDSHRASLLFELRARASRQFALYSLVSAQAQQTFVTGIIE
ncbi:MAG TPA: hypothetical protein VIJ65_05825 [Acidobacteriaceae bacterium]